MNKLVLMAVAAGFLTMVTAQAQYTIISDNFTGPDGLSANGRLPDGINLPGSAWSAGTYWNPSIQNNTLSVGADTGVSISLASSGSYVEPAGLIESVTFTESSDTALGVGIGFGSAVVSPSGAYSYRSVFSGLVVTSSGSVQLWNQGSVLNTVAWSGAAFDPNTTCTMTYQIDTTSGGFTSLSLTGDNADFTSLQTTAANNNVFSTANIQYAEIWGNGPNAGNTADFSNVEVMSTPEPGTLALLGIGLAGAFVLNRRKQDVAHLLVEWCSSKLSDLDEFSQFISIDPQKATQTEYTDARISDTPTASSTPPEDVIRDRSCESKERLATDSRLRPHVSR
jgi:hypothetical protein